MNRQAFVVRAHLVIAQRGKVYLSPPVPCPLVCAPVNERMVPER